MSTKLVVKFPIIETEKFVKAKEPSPFKNVLISHIASVPVETYRNST